FRNAVRWSRASAAITPRSFANDRRRRCLPSLSRKAPLNCSISPRTQPHCIRCHKVCERGVIPKGLCSSARGCRECPDAIPICQAFAQTRALEVGMKNPSVEAVSGANAIHDFHMNALELTSFGAAHPERATLAELDDQNLDALTERGDGLFQVAGACDFLCLARVWHKNVDVWQRFTQNSVPPVVGIVVCIERRAQPQVL